MENLSFKKIYVVMVGSAPMPSLDALMMSLERFKTQLSSDSATTRFETTVRSIQENLEDVDRFIQTVYAERNPAMAVTMKGRTLIVEIGLLKNEFLGLINTGEVDKILAKVIAVGSMAPKKLPHEKTRAYISFPIRYEKNKFIKW